MRAILGVAIRRKTLQVSVKLTISKKTAVGAYRVIQKHLRVFRLSELHVRGPQRRNIVRSCAGCVRFAAELQAGYGIC